MMVRASENDHAFMNNYEPDESYHVCHSGYLSLFPLMMSILPHDSPRLGSILSLLQDPAKLWSPYGIRSLSADHPEFGQGENYWKGPIWMPMNYLVLGALHKVRDFLVAVFLLPSLLPNIYRPMLHNQGHTKLVHERSMTRFGTTSSITPSKSSASILT